MNQDIRDLIFYKNLSLAYFILCVVATVLVVLSICVGYIFHAACFFASLIASNLERRDCERQAMSLIGVISEKMSSGMYEEQ